MYWAASCGGCEIAVLNIHEKILDVDANFEVVFWPVAMDAKYKDVEAMPDESILLTLFNGGIRNSENEEMAHCCAANRKILVAFGSCACEGCIPGLANSRQPGSRSSTQRIQALRQKIPTDIRPQSSYMMPEGEIHIPTSIRFCAPRPGGAGGLLHAWLPTRIAPDRGGDRAGDPGAAG